MGPFAPVTSTVSNLLQALQVARRKGIQLESEKLHHSASRDPRMSLGRHMQCESGLTTLQTLHSFTLQVIVPLCLLVDSI